MIYDTSDKFQEDRAKEYFEKLLLGKKIIEVKEKRLQRTCQQNRYLHLLIGIFAMETGYTIEEAKLIYKRLNKEIYVYKKKGERFIKSSADLDTLEMTKSIDRLRMHCNELDIYLPYPHEQEALIQAEIAINNNQYL